MNTILRKQFLAHVGQTSPEPMMIEVARAEGVFFYTPEGKRYYDLVAGVSVSNVGHANPRVVEAVQRRGLRVSVVSTIKSSPPMVADELRRQADDFIELSELAPLIARTPSERAPRPAAAGGARDADAEYDDAPSESLMRSA